MPTARFESRVERQEVVRKLIHMSGALGPPVGIALFGWTGAVAVLLFLLSYFIVGALMERRGARLPMIAALLERTRRSGEGFPVAPLEFLVAILAVGLLFTEQIFFPAVAVLAFGDGAASLVGRAVGPPGLPWNRSKTWAGLLAGVVFGLLAALLWTGLGEWVHGESLADEPLLRASPILAVPLVLLGAFLLLWGLVRVVTDRGWAPRVANTRPEVTLAALAASLFVAALPLIIASTTSWLQEPLVAYRATPINNTDVGLAYVAIAAVATMFLESVLRRNDNLVIPIGFAVLNFLLLSFDPLGLAPPVG